MTNINGINTQIEELILSKIETDFSGIEAKDKEIQELRKKLAEREANLAIHMAVSVEKAKKLAEEKKK